MARSRTIRARIVEVSTLSTSTSRPDTETEGDGEPNADGVVEMETALSRDQDMNENMPTPLPRVRRTVSIVADSPSLAAGAVGVAGGSDALDVEFDAHVIINANAADEGAVNGIVALDKNVNGNLAMGAPSGAPGVIDATPHMRTNMLTLSTRNLQRERHHHYHHPHIHGREELTLRTALATLPMHTRITPAANPTAPGAGPSSAANEARATAQQMRRRVLPR